MIMAFLIIGLFTILITITAVLIETTDVYNAEHNKNNCNLEMRPRTDLE